MRPPEVGAIQQLRHSPSAITGPVGSFWVVSTPSGGGGKLWPRLPSNSACLTACALAAPDSSLRPIHKRTLECGQQLPRLRLSAPLPAHDCHVCPCSRFPTSTETRLQVILAQVQPSSVGMKATQTVLLALLACAAVAHGRKLLGECRRECASAVLDH